MKETVLIDGDTIEYEIRKLDEGMVSLDIEGENYSFNLEEFGSFLTLKEGEKIHKVYHAQKDGGGYLLSLGTTSYSLEESKRRFGKQDEGGNSLTVSPMPGRILKILVSKGDSVSKGTPLVIVEAMKMEHTIKASFAGSVQDIPFKEGDPVDAGASLVTLIKDD